MVSAGPEKSGALAAATNRALLRRWESRTQPVLFVIDSDPERAAMIRGIGREVGYNVEVGDEAAGALVMCGRLEPDVVIIAGSLGGLPQHTLVRAIRDHLSSTIIAANEPDDASGFDAPGAVPHTVLRRPDDGEELRAALTKAATKALADRSTASQFSVGPITLNSASFEVTVGDAPITLNLLPFELLHCLMEHHPALVTYDELRLEVWKDSRGDVSLDAIKANARRLRAALGGVADVVAVAGRGYRLALAPQAELGRA